MKLLDNCKLEAVNSALHMRNSSCHIIGRLESYSCKMVGVEKTLFKKMNFGEGRNPNELEVLRPNEEPYATSPTRYHRAGELTEEGVALLRARSMSGDGALCNVVSRRTLFHLISTLNVSFPDYDFSSAGADEFSREPSLNMVVANIDTYLSAADGEQYNNVRSSLWSALDTEIVLRECDIYRYNPDLHSDPFGEDGCLWSFNYFFFNKKLKRIVFFTCRAISGLHYEADNDMAISSDDQLMFADESTDADSFL